MSESDDFWYENAKMRFLSSGFCAKGKHSDYKGKTCKSNGKPCRCSVGHALGEYREHDIITEEIIRYLKSLSEEQRRIIRGAVW